MSRKLRQDLQRQGLQTTTIAPVLISRANASIILAVSPQTLIRAEREGVLEARRIRPNAPASYAFYRITDIASIAGIEPADVVMQLMQLPTEKPKQIEQEQPATRERVPIKRKSKRGRPRKQIERKRLGAGDA